MATLARLLVELGLDPKDFDKGLKKSGSSLSAFGQKLSGIGRDLTTRATLPLAAFAAGAVDAASDLNESMSAVSTVFGDSAKDVAGFGGSVAEQLGLSRQEALGYASTLGALYTGVGLNTKAAAEYSNAAQQGAADLASFYNDSPVVALDAIRSGLIGQFEPLRKYGIILDAAAIEQEALNSGIWDGSEAMTDAQRVQATQAAIMKRMGAASGDFARTSGGLANQQRILKAEFKDMLALWGQRLLPLALKLVRVIRSFMGVLQTLSPRVMTVALVLGAVVAAAGPVLMVVGSIASGAAALAPILGALVPFILPIIAVAAAVAGLYFAWKHNFLGIRDITGRALDWITGKFFALMDALQPFLRMVRKIGSYLRGVFVGDFQPIGEQLEAFPSWLRPIVFVLARIVKTASVFIRTWQKFGALAAFNKMVPQIKAFGRAISQLFGAIGMERTAEAIRQTFWDLARLFQNVVALFDDLVHGRWSEVWTDLKAIGLDLFWLFIDRFKVAIAIFLDIFELIPWTRVGNALKDGLIGALSFLVDTGIPWALENGAKVLGALFDSMTAFWDGTLLPWLKDVGAQLLSAIVSKDTFNLFYGAGNFILDALSKGLTFAWDWLWGWFKGLAGRLLAPFADLWSGFYNIGWSIIAGMSAGIQSVWNTLTDWINSIIDQLDRIPSWLRPGSPSKTMEELNLSMIQGLSTEKNMPMLEGAVDRINSRLAGIGAGFSNPTITGRGSQSLLAGAGAGGGQPININVYGANDDEALARKVALRLQQAQRRVAAGEVQ